MKKKMISQREAQRLRKRVAQLEREDRDRRNVFAQDYPSGVNFDTVSLVNFPEERAAIHTAQVLGYIVIGKISGNNLMLFAVKP